MSKTTLTILCTVIGLIILGMYLEVKALSGGVGAFIVIALVYSFVVAKREAALMSYALEEKREAEREAKRTRGVVVPEWLGSEPVDVPVEPAMR